MTDHNNRVAADLTEASFLEAVRAIRDEGNNFAFKPTKLVISDEGVKRARAMAAEDPEFKEMVKAEFPQLAHLLD